MTDFACLQIAAMQDEVVDMTLDVQSPQSRGREPAVDAVSEEQPAVEFAERTAVAAASEEETAMFDVCFGEKIR